MSLRLPGDSRPSVDVWLRGFDLDRFLHDHFLDVLIAVPFRVREDVMTDCRFRVFDYEPGPGCVCVPVSSPARGALGGSRCVVLKRTLRERAASFVRYVIAHELAHAHLRNLGRHPGEDPEHAADALAAEWGFPRP